ncbi:MAG: protein-L-isoaspartate(D-aspartate) O-methyltransferase [Acidobacteriota bacterium]|nr:protein-L-isoaspartate(D-aspartate) O-methyltransferase [Acidobacteriota bacterium]
MSFDFANPDFANLDFANLDFAKLRTEMVDKQLRERGIHDERVLAVMGVIPRERFIPEEEWARAYGDEPVPIGYGQTISQPFMTAFMAQALELTGDENVLDIGAGSGYHAAVLGQLAKRVISIEIVPELAQFAQENLVRAGLIRNITVVQGDGGAGFPERAPFDAISVAAGAPDVPPRLLDQLNDPGRLVIPVGPLEDQELRLVTKRGGRIESRVVTLCRFVPLRGAHGWK